MHDLSNIGPKIIFRFGDSNVFITETVIWSIFVAVLLIVLALFSVRKMEKIPKGKQVIAEKIVETVYNFTGNTMGKAAEEKYAPYMGTLFFFLFVGSSLALIGLRPTTTDVNTTFALAFITFILIQAQAIKSYGVKGKLKEMCEPYPFMFPLKIIEQVSFPISLAFRIFGNILGGEIVMVLVFRGTAYLSQAAHLPIPAFSAIFPLFADIFFDIFEPLLQSFIFTTLTMVFISMEVHVREKIQDDHSV